MKNHDLNFLQAELSRVSEWVQFADKKAGFVGVFYSAIFGFLITKRDEIFIHIFSRYTCNSSYTLFFLIMLIALGIGVYHLFATVSPCLKNGNTSKSLFYFGTVARMKVEDYLQNVEKLTEEEARREIIEQIHTNSVIADTKMTNIKKSISALIGAGVIMFILFFIL